MDKPVDITEERRKRKSPKVYTHPEKSYSHSTAHMDELEKLGITTRNTANNQRMIEYTDEFKNMLLTQALEYPTIKRLCANIPSVSKEQIYKASEQDPDWREKLNNRMLSARREIAEDFFVDASEMVISPSQAQFSSAIVLAKRDDALYRDNPAVVVNLNNNVNVEHIGQVVGAMWQNEELMRTLQNGEPVLIGESGGEE